MEERAAVVVPAEPVRASTKLELRDGDKKRYGGQRRVEGRGAVNRPGEAVNRLDALDQKGL